MRLFAINGGPALMKMTTRHAQTPIAYRLRRGRTGHTPWWHRKYLFQHPFHGRLPRCEAGTP